MKRTRWLTGKHIRLPGNFSTSLIGYVDFDFVGYRYLFVDITGKLNIPTGRGTGTYSTVPVPVLQKLKHKIFLFWYGT
jgi:hypothetical protein